MNCFDAVTNLDSLEGPQNLQNTQCIAPSWYLSSTVAAAVSIASIAMAILLLKQVLPHLPGNTTFRRPYEVYLI